jgi:hypothetical protein
MLSYSEYSIQTFGSGSVGRSRAGFDVLLAEMLVDTVDYCCTYARESGMLYKNMKKRTESWARLRQFHRVDCDWHMAHAPHQPIQSGFEVDETTYYMPHQLGNALRCCMLSLMTGRAITGTVCIGNIHLNCGYMHTIYCCPASPA